ncbi:MAG: hypothetical protein F4155_08405 [Acidimicrobiales bacterium]|nr:hypothetical protein [Acidimicrobiales bacterium]MYH74806.1 hypothetical protein [Acidimicrobiales bacterium]MYK70372.1 hypothetical protein [Acidimicrobiales bacterium]
MSSSSVIAEPSGEICTEDGREWYRITDYDHAEPFLINVVTLGDLWLFVSSSGALTAGRYSADLALFPYETDDRLHRSGGRTGPFTLIRGGDHVWEPFAPHASMGSVRRTIAKTVEGDQLRFTEQHDDLGLTFSYTWSATPEYGFVRSCELTRSADRAAIDVEVLDGLIDVLPSGVELAVQQQSSTLVDAYRRSEYDGEAELALFTLEALISDRPDPAESLHAAVVWSRGLGGAQIVLSDRQVRLFRSGHTLEPEHLVTGRKGSFLLAGAARLEPGTPLEWVTVADTSRSHADVAQLRRWLRETPDPRPELGASVDRMRGELVRLVASADGLQRTADRRVDINHYSNVLYNCMRGGVPLDDYRVELADVGKFVTARNTDAAQRFAAKTAGLDTTVGLGELHRAVVDDTDLFRLVDEYLPLSFSRRHGDPSRPWNEFRIGAEGESSSFAYEGNWRDIFQNWEALVTSFPMLAHAVVAKFLNASTCDGHNPYRITSDGIDWEMPDEGSWSNFGYWGDHQIVYLHRLLELAHRHIPGLLESLLGWVGYASANVPYRMLPYSDMVADPKRTLRFDADAQAQIDERTQRLGTDGKLVLDAAGSVHHVSLAEKLLLPALAKISSLVPGGGIWLNAQRPEWNDANNALAGIGLSVVTVIHLRDYLAFIDRFFTDADVETVPLSAPVTAWLSDVLAACEEHAEFADVRRLDDTLRRSLSDRLGAAFEEFRARIYDRPPEPPQPTPMALLRRLTSAVRPHLDAVVDAARRPDGLVDSYRLVTFDTGVVRLESLPLMLEGQVALLGSATTSLEEAVGTLDALFASDLYRSDQRSFLLHPDTSRPSFMERNQIPAARITDELRDVLNGRTDLMETDSEGSIRFASWLTSSRQLEGALDELQSASRISAAERAEIAAAYEAVFQHQSFIGRAQTMYRYEGLGSIYWHMVMKLLVAIQRQITTAVDSGADGDMVNRLIDHYRRIRSGLGFLKSAGEHGAFPLEPYSHTPADAGAQQPGMTGAAKDGILLRWGELGVQVRNGRVRFRPVLLDADEFLQAPKSWAPLGPDDQQSQLSAGTLGFTYCGVPVIYRLAEGRPSLVVTAGDGASVVAGDELDADMSELLFSRSGAITSIEASVELWPHRPARPRAAALPTRTP